MSETIIPKEYEQYLPEEREKDLEVCPICHHVMSDEEYEDNRGVCDGCAKLIRQRYEGGF